MILRIIERLDQIPHTALLIINLCLAIFIIIAHGGYLIAKLVQDDSIIVQGFRIIFFTLPLSFLIFFTSIVSFFNKSLRAPVLKIHASILSVGAIICFLWAINILIKSFPEGGFSWSPGLLTFFCFYPIYILRRSLFKYYSVKLPFFYYIHIWLFLIFFSIDIGIFIKLLLTK